MFIFGIGCVCVAGGEVEREGAILLKQFVYQSKWTRISLKQGASDFSLHQDHLEDLLKHLGFLIQWVWSGSQEFVFLICSQVTLMLLVQGLYFENQCSTLGDMLHGWNYQVFSHMNDQLYKIVLRCILASENTILYRNWEQHIHCDIMAEPHRVSSFV